jgi:hypothetical protein
MKILNYALLGLYLNGAIDSGNYSDITTHTIGEKIKNGTILEYLEEIIGVNLFYLLTNQEKEQLLDEWQRTWNAYGTSKMRVKNNGLCLLVAYIFDKFNSMSLIEVKSESDYAHNNDSASLN